MAIRETLLCVLALIVGTWAFGVPAAAGVPESVPPVVVVQSYDAEYVWTQQINQGLREALKDEAALEAYYLDAKRHPDPEILRRSSRDILARIDAVHARLVVAADDAAQAWLVVPHLKGRQDVQVVFCGVNAPLDLYGFPASNVSGVRERWHCREGFALIRKILPSARTAAFLIETSESAGYVVDDLREDLRQGGPYALELAGVEQIKTFQEWQRRVLYYQSHADVLALGLYNALVDERTGKVVPPDEVMAWTNAVNTKPTLGFSDIAKGHGILCGVLESGREQGWLAGKMAREVLATGRAAGRFPVEINATGVILVNLNTAERLGVRIPYEIIEAAGEVVR